MVVVKQPPGPKGHFLLGNIPDYRRGQLEFLERCAREYGDIVRLRLGYHRIFLVNHPDAIEEVLLTKSRNFIKHFALRLTPVLLPHDCDPTVAYHERINVVDGEDVVVVWPVDLRGWAV